GSFLLSLKNLLRLNFLIRDGGRITWTGDPTDANVALNAVYKTRVTLSGLTSDQDKANLRIPVDCIIRMNGRLMNPEISFGMELPNVDEDIKSLVYGAIDTSNASVMNQQMMYVLVMNQFKPVTGSSFGKFDVGTTSLSLLTNQVSSLFSKISNNLRVGINYKPGTQNTTNEFDVSVSTQLLNDRLMVDGLFGMSSNYTTSVQKANTVVGDVNLEYFLTGNRRWRLRVFNRTNVVDVLNNNAPYTQGVGISFQRDFNAFGDLFKKEKTGNQQGKGKKK
ncbi:MAG: translocation/assembly module TamB domain-containing protein, partial [Bacteroidota bacterium]|nr:translocation/assembly module TamB domain-containing protein [Bacteroidota bacterium]